MGESENLNEISSELIASIEALLFVAAEPVSPTNLAMIIEITPAEIQELLEIMQEICEWEVMSEK